MSTLEEARTEVAKLVQFDAEFGLGAKGQANLDAARKLAKAAAIQQRRDDAAVEQAYAGKRSAHEAILEAAFLATQEYIDAKAALSLARIEAVESERLMRRHNLPIAESVASFESRWFQSERWADFHARAKTIFGGKLL